jgi:hypothetical protein
LEDFGIQNIIHEAAHSIATLCQHSGSRCQLNLMKNQLMLAGIGEAKKFPVIGLATENGDSHNVFLTRIGKRSLLQMRALDSL